MNLSLSSFMHRHTHNTGAWRRTHPNASVYLDFLEKRFVVDGKRTPLNLILDHSDVTPAGLNVSVGPSPPTLVQGFGTMQTVMLAWDADGTTGDRVVLSAWKDANNYLVLHFVSGILRFESFVAGVSEGYVAVADVDDGNTHSALLCWDEVAGTLSLDVDGQGLEGPEIFVNGSFDTWTDPTIPDGWTKSNHNASNYVEESPVGSARLVSVDTNTAITQAVFTEGLVYGIDCTDVVVTTGNIALWYGSLKQTTLPAGSLSLVVEPSTTVASIKRVSGVTDGSIGGISGNAIYSRTGLTLPTGLTQFALGHLASANALVGFIQKFATAEGNQMALWSSDTH